jgi:RNA polymerase sigma-70 factor (ECF subfamily)
MNDFQDHTSDHDADRVIIARVLDGNKDDFRYIIEKYERRIRAYTSKFLGYHQQDIEDVTSEVFIKVYINLAKYNPKLQFSSWLYRIAHNEAINYSKKNSKHLSVDIDKQDWRMGYTIDFDKPRKEDIEKVLQQLNTNDRNLLLLFYIEELSIREISEILKTTENSVKSRLSQARKKLKK